MKMALLTLATSLTLIGSTYAQGDTDSESVITAKITSKYQNQWQIAYETFTPIDRDDYNYQGANIAYQLDRKFEDSSFVMLMRPNISALTDDYRGNSEDVIFVKWNQGFAYNADVGQNQLLQPVLEAGVGYATIDNDDTTQNSPLFEMLLGLNYFPVQSLSVYAKGGYRFVDFDDKGGNSIGSFKGSFGMLGLGMIF